MATSQSLREENLPKKLLPKQSFIYSMYDQHSGRSVTTGQNKEWFNFS